MQQGVVVCVLKRWNALGCLWPRGRCRDKLSRLGTSLERVVGGCEMSVGARRTLERCCGERATEICFPKAQG